MPSKKSGNSPDSTKSELEILQVLWEHGPSTVRFVYDELNKEKRGVQYTSTLKLMQIMIEKGLVVRDESSMKHIYRPAEEEQKTKAFLLERFIDKNINQYLRSWKVPENEFTRDSFVTIRKILNHTAGFPPYDFSGFHPDSAAPTLLQVLKGEPPAHNPPISVAHIPGTKTDYTGAGYIILQQLLVDMFQLPFNEIMKQNIFKPLKMTSSTFENPIQEKNLYANAAVGYQRGAKVDAKKYTKPMQASGGLWSNVHDLAL